MKYEWKKYEFTPKDFEGAGQYIVRESKLTKLEHPHIENTGYLSTLMQKVGWIQIGSNCHKYVLVSMSDGLIMEGYSSATRKEDGTHEEDTAKWVWNDFSADSNSKSKEKLCEYLNNNPYKETFRFATNEELIRVASYQKLRTK